MLFLLYFLEANDYRMGQSTLNMLLEYGQEQGNHYVPPPTFSSK